MSDRVTNVPVQMQVIKLGTGFIGSCTMGGMTFRGNRYSTPADALRDVGRQIANENNPDAALAVDLAAAGEDLEDIQAELDQDRKPARTQLSKAANVQHYWMVQWVNFEEDESLTHYSRCMTIDGYTTTDDLAGILAAVAGVRPTDVRVIGFDEVDG